MTQDKKEWKREPTKKDGDLQPNSRSLWGERSTLGCTPAPPPSSSSSSHHHLSRALIFFYGSSHLPSFYSPRPVQQTAKCRRHLHHTLIAKMLLLRENQELGRLVIISVNDDDHAETRICQIMSSDSTLYVLLRTDGDYMEWRWF